MKRIFLDFRTLIETQLQSTVPANAELLSTLAQLKRQLIDSICLATMGFGKEACVIRQLHHLQKGSILLSDKLFVRIQQDGASAFLGLAQSGTFEILENLKFHNAAYFNLDEAIPLYHQAEVRQVLEQKILLLQAGLKSCKIEAELQSVLLHPFANFGTKGNNSYMQMRYVLKHIDTYISNLREGGSEEGLLYALLCSGFNGSAFNRYYTKKIAQDVKTNLSVSCQLERLYDYEAQLRCLSKKTPIYYDSRNESIRTTALKFVRAEIQCLHNKQKLSAPTAVAVRQAQGAEGSDYRLKTSLSVDGLAYLLRLLVEADVIEASPKSELFSFIAGHVQTCGNAERNLSVHSLTTKYKQVTQFTASRVRSVLVKMSKQAEDSFNL